MRLEEVLAQQSHALCDLLYWLRLTCKCVSNTLHTSSQVLTNPFLEFLRGLGQVICLPLLLQLVGSQTMILFRRHAHVIFHVKLRWFCSFRFVFLTFTSSCDSLGGKVMVRVIASIFNCYHFGHCWLFYHGHRLGLASSGHVKSLHVSSILLSFLQFCFLVWPWQLTMLFSPRNG